MSKVNILLSTYNGEQNMKRQLDSLVNQTYKDFRLYVRDDGSVDNSVRILQSYEHELDMEILQGENIGFVKSFMYLLQYAEEGEYWAFCDQDDWWDEDKILKAVEWLETQEQRVPLLYHSAYEIVDSATDKRDIFYFKEEGYNFCRSITENHFSGFSMVINRTMRDKMLKGNMDEIDFHDWWAAMIVTAFGKFKSDEQILARYYRYSESVTRITIGNKVRWFIRMLKSKSDIRKRSEEFYRVFGNELSPKDRKIVELFVMEKYNLKKSITKAFYPKRWRPNLSSEIFMRVLMLLGRI